MSDNFIFQTVSDIRFGTHSLEGLAQLVRGKYRASRVLIVSDQGLVKAGIVARVVTSLEQANIGFEIYDRVIADPSEAVVQEAAAVAANVDLVIGLGGGSSLDCAKLAAILAMQQQNLPSMYGVDQVNSARKPLILIPTTAGTGSEVTPIAVVTTGESTKAGVVSPVLYADTALLDPALLYGLPPHITAETGIDAMVHAIEAYTSKIKKNPISDHFACKALSLLASSLPIAYVNGKDSAARSESMLGSMLAGQAFANAPVGAVHALAYPLGGLYHIAHGLSNALMLCHVLRFNLSSAALEYAELAQVLMPTLQGSVETKSQALIDYLHELTQSLGLNRRLRDFGIKEDALPVLAEQAMLQTRLLQNNPRELSLEDALSIYQAAW